MADKSRKLEESNDALNVEKLRFLQFYIYLNIFYEVHLKSYTNGALCICLNFDVYCKNILM